jgi:SSS family solute:Na+ symporter
MNFGLPAVDYIVIAVYLAIMLGVGFYFTRFMKGGKDFFVGGNLIPWWVAGVSLYMTLFSAWTFTGAASFTYNTGWYGILFFITWPISFFIGFKLLAKKWRRTRVTTPVEYVQSRFNKTTHLFLTIMLTLSSIYWPAHHLASLAKITAPTLFPNSMMAIDIMIIVIGIIILIYTFSGGLWAVCITDVVQFLILIAICVVLIPTAFLSSDLGSVADFVHKVPPLQFTHVIRGKEIFTFWYLIGYPAALIFSYASGGNAQRYYSVKDEKSAERVGWTAFWLFLLGPILFGLPPLIGKVLWPDISALQYFSGITKADENIYVAVVLHYMPAGMVGIFLSAMMAASMSAMDSAWNALSAIVSVDIYKNFFRPKASEKEVLLVGRISVIFFCAFAIGMALFIIHSQYGVFTFTSIFFGLTGVPVAIPLFLGIMVKKISRWSAISSIIAGTLMASVGRFALKYTLGPQYLITVAITLLFIFLSQPLGAMYNRNKKHALLNSTGLGIILWIFFMISNSNPNLSFATFDTVLGSGIPGILVSAHFWVIISAIAFIVLSYKFSAIYARDLLASQENVEAFFKKMDTPIDVEKEVFSRGEKEVNMFPLVGGISMGLSLLTLLILIVPAARTKIGVNIAVSTMLFLIGLIMFLSKYFYRATTDLKSEM